MRSRSLLLVIVLVGLALPGMSRTARAQDTFFPTDTTIGTVFGNAVVGYANDTDLINGLNPTSPTVRIDNSSSVSNAVFVYNSSTVNMTGGITLHLSAGNSSTVNLSGGTIRGDLFALDSSTINFFGTGLGDTLIRPDIMVGSRLISQYSLHGTLSDGQSVSGVLFLQDGTGATVNFLPEPGASAFLGSLGLTGAAFLRHRKRAR